MAELTRKSVYDVLMHNLQLAKRRTYIHRYIYFGEHKNENGVEDIFSKIYRNITDNYHEEGVTGLLVLYPNYFIHIVDGGEQSIHRHLDLLYSLDKNNEVLGEIRLLGFYHHVNQRFFDEWGVRRAKPPILLEKINPASDFDEVKRYLNICVKKIYNLAIQLRQLDWENDDKFLIGEIQPSMSQFLPEYNLLYFLLNSNDVYALKPVSRYPQSILKVKYDLELIWPVRSDFVPFNVFDEEINPIQNLPNYQGKQ